LISNLGRYNTLDENEENEYKKRFDLLIQKAFYGVIFYGGDIERAASKQRVSPDDCVLCMILTSIESRRRCIHP
jgi:hypothetical protein